MKNWLEKIKNKMNIQELDRKQALLGVVILFVAILFLAFAFKSEPEAPQTANVVPALNGSNSSETTEAKAVEPTPVAKAEAKGNVTLHFTATTERDMEYKLYYTVSPRADFDGEHVVAISGKKGTDTYSVELPVSQIAKFNIQLEPVAGTVTFKDISLSGSQEADLNNFNAYEFWQVEDVKINADNSLSFLSRSSAPSLVLYRSLMPEEETAPAEENNAE